MKLLLPMDSRVANQAAIGLLDARRGEWSRFQVIDIPQPYTRRGFRGSALVGTRLYAVNSAAVYAFDLNLDDDSAPLAVLRETFRRPEWELGERAAADLHDVHFCAERGTLLIANSRLDSLDEISLSGELVCRHYLWDVSEEVARIAFDRMHGVADLTHVNHISEDRGRIYLTLGNCNGTRSGKVIRFNDGITVLDELEFPHDGFVKDGDFFISQTGTSEILMYPVTDGGELVSTEPEVLPVQARDDRWLGSFQWVRGIAVSERHIIAGVTQWRKDAAQRPQMPPRLVFYDRATKRFEGDLFLPPVEGFPMPCIFTIHVVAAESGETVDPSGWRSRAPEAQSPEATDETAAQPRRPAPCLHFHSSADRTALSNRWNYPHGPRRRIRVLPEGSLWIDADLNEEEYFYLRTDSGPFSMPPDDPIPLDLQPGRTYQVSVFCNRVRGEPHLQLWIIQYDRRDRLCHEVRSLTWGHNRLPFTCDPRLHSVCLAFRVTGRGVAQLAPVDLFAVGP